MTARAERTATRSLSLAVAMLLAVPACGGHGEKATAGDPDSRGATPASGGKNDVGAGGSAVVNATGGTASSSGGHDSDGARDTGGARASGGTSGKGGATSSGGGSGNASAVPYGLVTSVNGIWTEATWTEAPGAAADVTLMSASTAQTWEGFSGAFHEMGWNLLTTKELREEAVRLLFDAADGARLSLARIPIGASDYALERYTLDDTGTNVTPDGSETNRPSEDPSLAMFSIARDQQYLIPHVQAALAANPSLRLWAEPYTPPVWMKTGYKQDSSNGGAAPQPSYYDGGSMKSDAGTLSAYAKYLVRFVQAYQAEGLSVDAIAVQHEPTFDQNYPSCLWDSATYTSFVRDYLGPALTAETKTKIVLGSMFNHPKDADIASAVTSDPAARSFVGRIGVAWDVLFKAQLGALTNDKLPLWATEHKVGNYPFITSARAATETTPAIAGYTEPPPNDQAYAVESWWYIRDAITKAKVTSYNVPHLVLDAAGLGNDTGRSWAQNSLLTVSGGKITATQAYYVVRHISQFVDPGAVVIGTSGGDAIAFKNPDGSLVAVVFSEEANDAYTLDMAGKKLSFVIPAGGWATLKYKP